MSDLYIFDPYDNLVAILSNDGEGACPFWSAPFKELLNQGTTLEFTAAGNHEDSQHIVAENQVAFMDKDGFFRLFTIKEPERTDGEDGPVITAVCEAAMLELNDEVIEDVRPYNVTLKTAVTKALEGVRWKVGEVAELGLDSTNFYYMTPTEAITECINTWGGELRDRVEIEGNRITGRFIDILPRRGEDIGKQWEIDKDILSITERVQSYPKTALYGRGSSLEIEDEEGEATGGFTRKITFADIEWKVKNGDPVDKPKGQKWVGDPEALTVFGRENADGTLRHRKGIYESSEQEDPAALLQETWEALQQQKHPIRNFEMSVFLLESIIGYEHEKVRLGDTTFALDYSFAKPIEVEERVISFEYDVSDPDNSGVVELGNFIDLYSDDARLDQIESELNDNKGVWNNGGKRPITDDRIENVTPSQPKNVMASGLFQNVLVEWDFVNTISIANYEVYASEIQGFTPDISNLAFRGKTSIYTHQAGSNQQWYFRVRAVNTHGVSGPFPEESMAQTARIISDDILFGPEIAEELRELSKEAQLLADGTVGFNMIAEDVKTPIQNAVDQANHAVLNANTATSHALDAIAQAQLSFDSATDAIRKADDATGQVSVLSQTVFGIQSTVSDKVSTSQFTQLAGVVDTKISTVDADGKFATQSQLTQTANSLTSTITHVQNNLDQVEMTTTSRISQLADNINLRVKENDVVNQINISTEGILIDGEKVHITGQTMIDNAVIATANIKDANITNAKIANLAVGTAAIANAAITNAKIANLSVGTAQLQDAAITNAKIANASIDSAKISSLSADKLNAGAIRGIDIFGSKFRSSDGSTNLEIVGGNVRLTQNGGSYVNMNPNGVYGYNSGGSERFRMDKGLVTSAALGTSNSNVYLAPDSTNEVRVVDLARIPSDGIAENYSYRPIRVLGVRFAPNGNGYLGTEGEIRITSSGFRQPDGSYIYRPLRAGNIYGTSFISTTTNAYIGTDNEVRLVNKGFIDGDASTPTYRPLRSGDITAGHIASHSGNMYIGSDDEVRIVSRGGYNGGNITWRNLRSNLVYANAVDINNGTHVYIRPTSGGEAKVTATGTTNNFRPIRARTFTTDTSMRENKKDIEVFSEDSLDVFRNAQIYTYRRLNDDQFAFKQLGMMIDETPRILHGEAGDSFDLYALTAYMGKGIKDIITITDKHGEEINWLKIENQYLKQKIKQLEDRMGAA
ncbi:phage tail spike protein [Peribacillus frigoritolerans]|uniref:phage tail spike protein n=1 Tax=Peribacillus frigoritolerans TaxID=450367 RepID=UPI00203F2B1B|nr:phage tail spike protein [Peribacillus frigoritolerans]MCM3169024.1 phage tail protein [Peribacillus frigoritolerans]